jgi:hypothetical protein
VPAEVHAFRPLPGTHCRASVMLRNISFVRCGKKFEDEA